MRRNLRLPDNARKGLENGVASLSPLETVGELAISNRRVC
jgi:hypothetical protein